MSLFADLPQFWLTLICASMLAAACGTLSIFVVARRWAFIGEGIAHSGFGGAGTVWLLALAFPALDDPNLNWLPYCGVVAFCLLTAIAIAAVTRRGQTGSDTAIGIFMVASVAWGFLAKSAYQAARHTPPSGWETFVFGEFKGVGPGFVVSAGLLCLAVMATVWLLGKEIISYCFDPATAEASGVPAGFIHYVLILLVTLTIIVGSRVVGSILVTALLVLPGATSLAISRRLGSAIANAIAIGLSGAILGVVASRQAPFLPAGPAIVLVLFLAFVGAFIVRRFRRTPH